MKPVEKYGPLTGTVSLKRKRTVYDHYDYEIRKLHNPTADGSTHVALDVLGEPVMTLSKDAEGCWLVNTQTVVGEIVGFFEDGE